MRVLEVRDCVWRGNEKVKFEEELMSRNRVKSSQSLHWATVMFWVILIGMMASLGVSYLVLKNRIIRIAEETRKQETELLRWKDRNAQLQAAIQTLRSPQELQRKVAHMGLVKVSELQWIPMGGSTGSTRIVRGISPEEGRR